ncbi:MAG: hypothetical protein ABIA63_04285 [bacterium]
MNMYLQLMQQQLPGKELNKVIQIAKNILEKIEQGDNSINEDGKGPKDISEEHFENVCKKCAKLNPDGSCADPITKKFPGKCDPIIQYERNKSSHV